MRVLIAFDKFKDCMSAAEACKAAAEGLSQADHLRFQTRNAPLTDGGEGFCEILTEAVGGARTTHRVTGPLGDPTDACIGWVNASQLPAATRSLLPVTDGSIAVIEMAEAAGIEQVPLEHRHPRNTSTKGVGELIRLAAEKGAAAIVLGIGGSATSDLGLGALETLGFEFVGVSDVTPSKWHEVNEIRGSGIELPPMFIACDVTNPLCGPQGAATVYGPQKGLRTHEIAAFDIDANRMADLLCDHCDKSRSCKGEPSSGAAGGMGFGLQVAFGASYLPGFELVKAWLNLDREIEKADLVLSGEGRIDASTLSGKGPYALAEAAHRHHTGCHLFAGACDDATREQLSALLPQLKIHQINPPSLTLEDALASGRKHLTSIIKQTFSP